MPQRVNRGHWRFGIPLLILILEIFIFFRVASIFGFLNAMAFYWAPSLLGILILSFQSRTVLASLQREMMQGRDPGRKLLGTAANFFAGLLFLAPFLLSRVFGILLLLPGIRHVILAGIRVWVAKKIAKGTFVFRGGFPPPGGGFPPGGGGFGGFPGGDFGRPMERDATVIDVTATEVESEPVLIDVPPSEKPK